MLPVPRTSFEGLNRGSQSWIDRFARRGITLVNFRIRVEMHTEWKNKNDAASRRVASCPRLRANRGLRNATILQIYLGYRRSYLNAKINAQTREIVQFCVC